MVVLSVLTGTKFGAVLDMVTDRFVPTVVVLVSIELCVGCGYEDCYRTSTVSLSCNIPEDCFCHISLLPASGAD